MNPDEAVQAVYAGKTVECSRDGYRAVRLALQQQAGKWIDQNDHVRSHIALSEVQRLDRLYNFEFE